MDIRSVVRNKYAGAAMVPQSDLCCPKDYPSEWISHIPRELLEFNYGCGSPVLKAKIKMGEHVVDIGAKFTRTEPPNLLIGIHFGTPVTK